MLSDRAASVLSRATTCGVVGLALGGFAMSYDALHSLAAAQGVPPTLAWLWPLVVDGFIVVASLSVVRAVGEGRSARYPWLLVLVFSGISIAFNVVHATPTPVARLVAAVPPTALVLSFELLMRQLRMSVRVTAVRKVSLDQPAVSQEHAISPAAAHNSPLRSPTRAKPRTVAASPLLEQARELCERHQRSGHTVTGAVLAAELNISDGYGRRLLRQLAAEPDAAATVGDAA